MEKPERRIKFVWNYLDWGGANIYLLAIMKAARGQWDIEVLLPIGSSQDILDMITALGVPYRLIDAALDKAPAPTLARKLRRQWRRMHAEIVTYRELKQEGLNKLVIHCELAPWQSWIFYWLLCRRGAQVFVTMHNALPEQSRWRQLVWRTRLRFLSRTRGFHIFPSNRHAKDSLRGLVDSEFWETMPVTYTCINPEEIAIATASPFDPKAVRQPFGIPENVFVVLTLGQFIDRKGRWTLLGAAKKIAAENNQVYFVWVTPELPNEIDMLEVESYRLGERFRLIRSRDLGDARLDVLRFFRVADAFVLPSFVEGLPIALLEAMAMALPVVSTNVYGIPEAVDDGKTGLLIEAGDADALAAKIHELATDHGLRTRLGKSARKFVLQNFDEREAARIALAQYASALDD